MTSLVPKHIQHNIRHVIIVLHGVRILVIILYKFVKDTLIYKEKKVFEVPFLVL